MATDMIARMMAARALKLAEEGGGNSGGNSEQFGLQSIEIDKDGNLVVTFTDGTISNLGRVVGFDGKVYVPHLDKDTNILSWTIEDKEGDIPDPVDLSDSGEWQNANKETLGQDDYEWEALQ